ncbi:hypothetical protein P3T27_002636 [Kitasatospora sp. MAA19]|nr:hypothetical protein [Kitasatospora sp. MAA19]
MTDACVSCGMRSQQRRARPDQDAGAGPWPVPARGPHGMPERGQLGWSPVYR